VLGEAQAARAEAQQQLQVAQAATAAAEAAAAAAAERERAAEAAIAEADRRADAMAAAERRMQQEHDERQQRRGSCSSTCCALQYWSHANFIAVLLHLPSNNSGSVIRPVCQARCTCGCRFSMVHGSFAKKEAALRDQLMAAEQQAAHWQARHP
jgi:hypothetical protein